MEETGYVKVEGKSAFCLCGEHHKLSTPRVGPRNVLTVRPRRGGCVEGTQEARVTIPQGQKEELYLVLQSLSPESLGL